jgi:hypothetical protein
MMSLDGDDGVATGGGTPMDLQFVDGEEVRKGRSMENGGVSGQWSP